MHAPITPHITLRMPQEEHPCALLNFSQIAAQAAGKLVAVFLDYDGTLTPIVSNPDQALMSEHAREAVRRVAQLFPTAVISGRGREKVQQFVRLEELYYAGSHGMDIVGPQVEGGPHADLAFQPAAQYAPLMDGVYAELLEGVSSIVGSSVEHNKFCVSVHFRNCAPEDYPAGETAAGSTHSAGGLARILPRVGSGCGLCGRVSCLLCCSCCCCGCGYGCCRLCGHAYPSAHVAAAAAMQQLLLLQEQLPCSSSSFENPSRALTLRPSLPPLSASAASPSAVVGVVDAVSAAHPELRVTRGRKVLEVRPQVDWDKGTALAHLLEMLGLADPSQVYCIYIGDDRTDEDAFQGVCWYCSWHWCCSWYHMWYCSSAVWGGGSFLELPNVWGQMCGVSDMPTAGNNSRHSRPDDDTAA